MDILFIYPAESEGFEPPIRRVRDSNPRYDVMRIPHFECGSFDHSDNSPSRSATRLHWFIPLR